MVKITLDAAEKLKALISEENKGTAIPETAGLRLFVQGGGCSGFQYGLKIESAPQENDLVVESNGVSIFIDHISKSYLEGALICWVDEMGGKFSIENPNAESTCGCGQSFQAKDRKDEK